MLVEEFDELGLFGGGGVVDVVFDEDAADLGDAEGVGVKVGLEPGGGVVIHGWEGPRWEEELRVVVRSCDDDCGEDQVWSGFDSLLLAYSMQGPRWPEHHPSRVEAYLSAALVVQIGCPHSSWKLS